MAIAVDSAFQSKQEVLPVVDARRQFARPSSVSGGQQLPVQVAAPQDSWTLFILPADRSELLDSAEVKKMEQFAGHNQRFLVAYDGAMDFIGNIKEKPLILPKRIALAPKGCEDVFSENIGDLGQRLFLTSKSVCRCFCLTFGEYQKLAQGVYYQRLQTVFNIADEPLPIQEFLMILPINEITKAVNYLTAVSESWPWMADLFMTNIYEMQGANGELKGEVAQRERALEELEKARVRKHEVVLACADCKGRLEQALADEVVMKSVHDSEGDLKQVYEKKLENVSKKRALAEKRLEKMAYKMYGKFKSVWVSDFKVVEDMVKRLADEEAMLISKIAQLTEASNKNLLEFSAKENRYKAVKAGEELKFYVDEAVPAAENAITKIEENIEQRERRIAKLIKRQGASNVDTFFQTMDAMKAVGKGASVTADGGSVVASGWVKDLNFVGAILNRMARSNTLEKQIKAFNELQKFTSAPENSLCQVLIHADPILTLTDCSGASEPLPFCSSASFNTRSYLHDDDEADLPQIDDLVKLVEFCGLPEVPDELVESAAGDASLLLTEAYGELLERAEILEEGTSGAACDQVFEADLVPVEVPEEALCGAACEQVDELAGDFEGED